MVTGPAVAAEVSISIDAVGMRTTSAVISCAFVDIYIHIFNIIKGIGKFQPPTKSIPLNQSTKNSGQLIMSAKGPCIPNLIQIHPLGASGQMGEI